MGRRGNVDLEGTEYESAYLTFSGNPILNSDVLGNVSSGPNDWIRTTNAKGNWEYTWDDKAVDQSTTPVGSEYVGKSKTIIDVNGYVSIMQDHGKIDRVSFSNYVQNIANPQVGFYSGVVDNLWGAVKGIGLLSIASQDLGYNGMMARQQIGDGVKSFSLNFALNGGGINPSGALGAMYLQPKIDAYKTGDPWLVTHTSGDIATDLGTAVLPELGFAGKAGGYTSKMAAIDQAVLTTMNPALIGRTPKVISVGFAGNATAVATNGSAAVGQVSKSLRLPAITLERWPLMQCAEPKVLNSLYLQGFTNSQISISTMGLRKPSVYSLGGLNYSSGGAIFLRAPCSNCQTSLKGMLWNQ